MVACMASEYTYTCPNCSGESVVSESLVSQNVICPHCGAHFFATPPEPDAAPQPQQNAILPAKVPFLKSGRKKILAERLAQLAADGELSKEDEAELTRMAVYLGLGKGELEGVVGKTFVAELEPIKRRIESTMMLTDEDLASLRALQKKYSVNLELAGNNELFRSVYLMEVKGQLPSPIQTSLMLDAGEAVYYGVETTWHQHRLRTRAYAGTSVSIPTGIKGVRFRFGSFSPVRTQEITPLSSGILYVTDRRLLFNGAERNAAVPLKKIINCVVHSDCLRVEKSSGKDDFFSMLLPQARYATALVGTLKDR